MWRLLVKSLSVLYTFVDPYGAKDEMVQLLLVKATVLITQIKKEINSKYNVLVEQGWGNNEIKPIF
jgi:hypothetical protein